VQQRIDQWKSQGVGKLTAMGTRSGGAGTHVDPSVVQEIFDRLITGVNEQDWRLDADALRMRGYGVFDLRIAGSGDVEIISPDCLNWWQVRVDEDGCWRLH
jgi:hypothetical protein